ncbi:MAG TPA: hypothetical protein VGR07_21500 [Thermoanaerobaculia bacterium]|jgi:hypothetical protein|nr:hypothetical protein [Thermoanaerobaculia bacterium]
MSSELSSPEGFQETQVVSVVDGQFQVELPPPVESKHLDFLLGEWVGYYNLAGMKLDVHAVVKWVYNHQYVQALNQQRGPIGVVESQEMWQPTPVENEFNLYFFDSFGGAGVGKAIWSDTGFVIAGDDPSTGPFRNTVTVRGNDDLLFHLQLGPDPEGNFREIGEGHYTRVKEKE